MKQPLKNPVYYSLVFNDKHLGFGSEKVKCFDENVSPFAGFEDGYEGGFRDLYEMVPPGRKILYATPFSIPPPRDWELLVQIKGLQFVFEGVVSLQQNSFQPTRLEKKHVGQMTELAARTKPGPFGPRTIEFGHYYGVFVKEQLVAMTGQRLHVENYSEVSAVCTHPDHLGKGYASALVQHQMNLILSSNQIPFLHVRADNERAIAIYEKAGFALQGGMNFYFFKK